MCMRGRDTQDGSSTTELVLLMPVVLTAVMLIVQTGLFLHARQVVEATAQEALEAAQAEFADAALGITAGEAFLAEAGGVRVPVVEVQRDASRVSVQVRGAAPNVLPGAVWSVTASASGEVERFVPETER